MTIALMALGLAACASVGARSDADGEASAPPARAAFDYQLGGAYPPPTGVEIVARDRAAAPADGLYNICYLNGFQTQPGELALWPDALLLRNEDGTVVYDPDWPDEAILDTRRANEIVEVVAPWIAGCADDGFDAVEFDNLDTYTRTDGILTRADNLALARALVTLAHTRGLAAGQKNAAEDAEMLHDEAGFDFAIVEECALFDECVAYTAVYGDHVLVIEYSDALDGSWAEVCGAPERPASLILRDRDLVPSGDPAYVYETCP